MKNTPEYFRGCLIGGAAGDALGWPVEFMSWEEIRQRYGPQGIFDLTPSSSGSAEVTDDTQMTLFTAEGILRARQGLHRLDPADDRAHVFYAYQRWLYTQGYPKDRGWDSAYSGWLLDQKELFARRAPGGTCLSALAGRRMGGLETPLNSSKGCGGVMRTAPAGLFYPAAQAFQMGAEFAALTHGHPSGYLSAGALAYLIARLIDGLALEAAVNSTMDELAGHAGHEECTAALRQAMSLAQEPLAEREAIGRIGQGWVGEEALAISVYCALMHPQDFKTAVRAAVNHSGDSDSTGAITGNILGAYLGLAAVPASWSQRVELRQVILRMADDLLVGKEQGAVDPERYPGSTENPASGEIGPATASPQSQS